MADALHNAFRPVKFHRLWRGRVLDRQEVHATRLFGWSWREVPSVHREPDNSSGAGGRPAGAGRSPGSEPSKYPSRLHHTPPTVTRIAMLTTLITQPAIHHSFSVA
jgi:hypothetical protein